MQYENTPDGGPYVLDLVKKKVCCRLQVQVHKRHEIAFFVRLSLEEKNTPDNDIVELEM